MELQQHSFVDLVKYCCSGMLNKIPPPPTNPSHSSLLLTPTYPSSSYY